MRRARIAAATGACGLALCVALAATTNACFDFDATVGGDDVAPADDGGITDASVVDADGALPPGDASDGGATGSDAGYCASLDAEAGVVLCESFDDGTKLPGLYFNIEGQSGGTLAKTTTLALSPPDALDLKTLARDSGAPNVALRANDIALPALPATMTFAFAVNPQVIDAKGGAAIVLGAVDFLDTAGNRYSVGLAINMVSGFPALALDEQSGLADGGMSNIAHVAPAVNALNEKAWNDVGVTIVWTASKTATASVTINGAVGVQPFALTMTVKASSLQVGIGTSYVTDPAPPWELVYDNVTFAAR